MFLGIFLPILKLPLNTLDPLHPAFAGARFEAHDRFFMFLVGHHVWSRYFHHLHNTITGKHPITYTSQFFARE